MSSTVTSPTWSCGVAANVAGGNSIQQATANIADAGKGAFTVGSAAGQVNKAYTAELSLTNAAATTIDLTTLVDAIGTTISLTSIEAIKIVLKSTVAGQDVTIGGGTNGVFTAFPVALKAKAGGNAIFFWCSPIAVDATHKILQLAVAAGTTVAVTVTILGR